MQGLMCRDAAGSNGGLWCVIMASKEVKKDIEDWKTAMNKVGGEFTISKQPSNIMSLINEIMDVKKQHEKQQTRINFLETRVSDLEQCPRVNDILTPRLRSYAPAKLEEIEDSEHDDTAAESQVTDFLHSKSIEIKRDDIEACHVLKNKNLNAKSGNCAHFLIESTNLHYLGRENH